MKIRNWLKGEESGQGIVEYALIIAGIALALIAVILTMGQQIANFFASVGDKIPP